jgi:hypothetical protein
MEYGYVRVFCQIFLSIPILSGQGNPSTYRARNKTSSGEALKHSRWAPLLGSHGNKNEDSKSDMKEVKIKQN